LSSRVSAEGNIEIEVRDDGRGIPEAERTQIFDRFYRASNAGDEGGDGLGLAIARSIVHAHGGELRCESVEGPGSRFLIVLPG
jgi:signal transduction histidine kinase